MAKVEVCQLSRHNESVFLPSVSGLIDSLSVPMTSNVSSSSAVTEPDSRPDPISRTEKTKKSKQTTSLEFEFGETDQILCELKQNFENVCEENKNIVSAGPATLRLSR